jgi:rhodanese-related sulfurtransferase
LHDRPEKPVTTKVTDVPPATAAAAAEHFESALAFETDCWDVHDSMTNSAPDFVLLDVRSRAAYDNGHIAAAVSQPHATITAAAMLPYAADTVFVVYCAGPHCNGAHRAASRLARLDRPVKIMIGGVAGWLDEGFELTTRR